MFGSSVKIFVVIETIPDTMYWQLYMQNWQPIVAKLYTCPSSEHKHAHGNEDKHQLMH